MARPQDTLADGLRAVKSLQDAGRVAIRSQDLKRDQREALLRGDDVVGGGGSTVGDEGLWKRLQSAARTSLAAGWTRAPPTDAVASWRDRPAARIRAP